MSEHEPETIRTAATDDREESSAPTHRQMPAQAVAPDLPDRLLGDEMPRPPRHASRVEGLRAMVLLAGSVRPTQLRKAVGRFILELPVEPGQSILDCWHDQAAAMVAYFGLDRLPVRVIVDHTSPPPRPVTWPAPTELRIERDPLEFRGTGGLLRDLASEYEDDDLILVAAAAQVLLEPLPRLAAALASAEGDVRILAQQDGTPSGMMLVRCGCLRAIPRLGFVDLNEQALPAIARSHLVRVVRHDQPAAMPVRTLSGYLDALREYHLRRQGLTPDAGALVEDWHPTFSVVEEGAQVDPTAVIHDSVVLAGGRVEPSAVLVRSLVCPSGRLSIGRSVVDRLVAGTQTR